MMMPETVFEIEEESLSKIVFTEYDDSWYFNVFHYLSPMKNHVHIATISTRNIEEGFKEAMMFLNKNLYNKIYEEDF